MFIRLYRTGDYWRYIAESSEKEKRQQAANKSRDAYEAAMAEATKDPGGLASTNPVRLGLALNYSVFHYEIDQNPASACQLAKDTFNTAVVDLEALPEENYHDSTLIMQLIRDNMTLWTSEADGEGLSFP